VTEPSGETPAASAARPTPLLVESIGGWRGLVDSGLPVVVFVAVNAIAGLGAAIWSAVGAGLVLFVLRLVRKETVQQAVSGFLGVALAAYIASRTGEAKGFFLLGIWASFVYAGLFAASVLVRWPLVGVVWEYVDGGGGHWRKDKPLMRVYTSMTVLWVVVFLSRGLVQRFLYEEDRTGRRGRRRACAAAARPPARPRTAARRRPPAARRSTAPRPGRRAGSRPAPSPGAGPARRPRCRSPARRPAA
jgi:hypothetical protein